MLRHRRRRRVESWAGRCTTKVGIKRRREEKKKRKGKEKRKIKENKRNGKSGSDDRWATARVEVPVYKLAVTTTHTLADLNTLFIPREGSPHPLPSSCLSARGKNRRGGREGHPRVHRTPGWCREAIHDAPIFIVFLASCFDPFPPPDVEGLNDFNHPLSSFFLLSSVLFEILSLSFHFFRETTVFRRIRRVEKLWSSRNNWRHALPPPPSTLLKTFATCQVSPQFDRYAYRLPEEEEEEEVCVCVFG